MTWLYIPLNYAPASECSEKAPAPHSSISDASTEPFVTWSGKPVPPAKLSRLWKRERLMKRLSGLTYSRSTAQLGADAFIASLPVSHARTCQSPVDEPGSMASGLAYSSTSSTSPTIAMRVSSFWRTSQASLLPPPPLWTKPKASCSSARPPESWENWPTAGGMRNGRIYERPTSVQITSVNDGSASPGAWLTPFGMNGITQDGRVGGGGEFAKQVASWATPDANAMERTNRSDSDGATVRPTLALAARNWATPRATDGTKGGPNQIGSKGDPILAGQAAQWGTPTVRDYKDGAASLENVEVNGLLGRQVLTTSLRPVHSMIDGQELSPTARTLRQRLNPAFACWLMGWPIWWTNPAITNSVKSETELWRSKLQRQLSSFFDEPVSLDTASADQAITA